MNLFEKWCWLADESPIPASPTIIARFVAELAPTGISKVWPAVLEISRAHYTIGLPDPTLSYLVTTAINKISGIEAPRSWLVAERERFLTLPYDLQCTISRREADRDRQIRTMQNEFAKLKKESENACTQTTTDHAAAVAA
jgi:hypothetical protein